MFYKNKLPVSLFSSKSIFILLLASIFLINSSSPVLASEDNFESLFSQMEEKTEPAEAPPGYFEKFWDNRSFTFSTINDVYLHSRSSEEQQSASLISTNILSFQSQFNIDRDILYLETWAEWSDLNKAYEQQPWFNRNLETRRNRVHLNQLYYTFGLDEMDLILGKKKVELGLASLYSPVDRYNRADLVDPIHPRAEGIWQLGLNYYRGVDSLEFFIMPVYEPTRTPPTTSRWSVPRKSGTFNSNFMNLPGTTEKAFPNTEPSDWQYLINYKTVRAGWDLFAAASHSISGPVVKQKGLNYQQKYFDVFNLSGGFSTVVDRWEFHGELLFQRPYDPVDDTFLKGVAGFKYKMDDRVRRFGIKKLETTFEMASEHIISKPDDDILFSTRDSRPGRLSYLLSLNAEKTEKLSYIVLSELDADKETTFLGLGLKNKINNDLNCYFWAEFFDASSDSQLEPWEDNDRIIFSLEYLI